jgi:hypothetical protein
MAKFDADPEGHNQLHLMTVATTFELKLPPDATLQDLLGSPTETTLLVRFNEEIEKINADDGSHDV